MIDQAIQVQILKQISRQRMAIAQARLQATQYQAIAEPQGFDSTSGLYLAKLPDGGLVRYQKGRVTPQSDSIYLNRSSSVSFGDWQ